MHRQRASRDARDDDRERRSASRSRSSSPRVTRGAAAAAAARRQSSSSGLVRRAARRAAARRDAAAEEQRDGEDLSRLPLHARRTPGRKRRDLHTLLSEDDTLAGIVAGTTPRSESFDIDERDEGTSALPTEPTDVTMYGIQSDTSGTFETANNGPQGAGAADASAAAGTPRDESGSNSADAPRQENSDSDDSESRGDRPEMHSLHSDSDDGPEEEHSREGDGEGGSSEDDVSARAPSPTSPGRARRLNRTPSRVGSSAPLAPARLPSTADESNDDEYESATETAPLVSAAVPERDSIDRSVRSADSVSSSRSSVRGALAERSKSAPPSNNSQAETASEEWTVQELLAARAAGEEDRVRSLLHQYARDYVAERGGTRRARPVQTRASKKMRRTTSITSTTSAVSAASAASAARKSQGGGAEDFVNAAKSGDLGAVRAAVEDGGVDVNSCDRFGWTALHRAVYWDRRDVIRYLLAHGADPSLKNPRGRSAADLAPSERTRREVEGDAYRTPAERQRDAKRESASRASRMIAREVSAYRRQKARRMTDAEKLVEAAKRGDLAAVRALVEESGIDINAATDTFGWTAIQRAVFWDRRAVIEYLVERGADIRAENPKGKSAVDMAASEELRRILEGDAYRTPAEREKDAKALQRERREKLILESEDGLNTRGGTEYEFQKRVFTPEERFVDACKRGDMDECKKLLEGGVDIDARDQFAWTGLHRAVFWDRKAVVSYLLEQGANTKLVNNYNQNIFDLSPSEEMLRILQGEKYVEAKDRGVARRAGNLASVAAKRLYDRTLGLRNHVDVKGHAPAGYNPETAGNGTRARAASALETDDVSDPKVVEEAARDIKNRQNLISRYIDEEGGVNRFDEDFSFRADGRSRSVFLNKLADEIERSRQFGLSTDERYEWAAMYVNDARLCREVKATNFQPSRLRLYQFLISAPYWWFMFAVIMTNITLVFYEAPSFRSYAIMGSFANWDSSWKSAFIVESICVFIYCVDLFLRYLEAGTAFLSSDARRARLVFVIATAVDMTVCATFGFIRVTRLIRVGLLIQHVPTLANSWGMVVRTIPGLLGAIIVLLVYIVLFGIVGITLFRERTAGEDAFSTGGDLYDTGSVSEHATLFRYSFNNFGDAVISLNVILTGSNYPNVMYPAYAANKWIAAIYFILYFTVGLYIFINVVIPLIYDAYKSSRKEQILRNAALERRALASAFLVLDQIEPETPGAITHDQLRKVVLLVRNDVDESIAAMVVQSLDADGSGLIEQDEFLTLTDALQFKITTAYSQMPTRSYLIEKSNEWKQRGYAFRSFVYRMRAACAAIVLHRAFGGVILVAVMLNTVVLALPGYITGTGVNVLARIDDGFVWFFTCEILLKLTAFNVRRFWWSNWNRFDFAVTFMSLVAFFLENFTELSGGPILLLSVFKVFRVFRIFSVTKKLREFITIVFDLLPEVSAIVVLLLLVIYNASLVGMELLHLRYVNLDDAKDLNYNSFESALLISFQVMFLTNWDSILLATRDTVDPLLQWFFFMYQFITIYLILNIIVAQILDNFEFHRVSKVERERDEKRKQLEGKDEKPEEKAAGKGVPVDAGKTKGSAVVIQYKSSAATAERNELLRGSSKGAGVERSDSLLSPAANMFASAVQEAVGVRFSGDQERDSGSLSGEDSSDEPPPQFYSLEDGARLVHYAKRGDVVMVERLLENGIDVDSPDEFGWSPLMRAVYWDRRNVVELLIREGANVQFKNPQGKGALDFVPSQDMRRYLLSLVEGRRSGAQP